MTASTPLPEKLASRSYRPPLGSLVAHAMAELRDGKHLEVLISAADRGEVSFDEKGPTGEPILSSALRGWDRWSKGEWDSPMPDELACFVSGRVWDGQGKCRPFEHLAAALIASGVELFPEGPYQMACLECAINEGASATAVSLLMDSHCPGLGRHPKAPELLSRALVERDTAVVRTMLDKGVDINAPTEHEEAPAWFAARTPQHLGWLIEAGADLSLTDEAGRTAPELWSRTGRVDTRDLKEMGQLLSDASPDVSASSHAAATFAALDAMKVGPVRSWLTQNPSVMGDLAPVPDVPREMESLPQKLARLFLNRYTLDAGTRRKGRWYAEAPPMGLLKLFIEHPQVSGPDRMALALIAQAMGNVLGEAEKSARKTWESLAPKVESVLSDEKEAEAGWDALSHVFACIAQSIRSTGSLGRTAQSGLTAPLLLNFHRALGKTPRWTPPHLFARVLVEPGPYLAPAVDQDLCGLVLAPLVRDHRPNVRRDSGPGPCPIDLRFRLQSDPSYATGVLVAMMISAPGGLKNYEDAVGAWEAAAPFLVSTHQFDRVQSVFETFLEEGALPERLKAWPSQWDAIRLDRQLPSPSRPPRKVRM